MDDGNDQTLGNIERLANVVNRWPSVAALYDAQLDDLARLVVVADISSSRILPVVPPDHGPISALAWSADGTQLAVGSETGFAALIDFAKR